MDFELSGKDKLFYFQRNFFTLDGTWMVVLEERLGLEETFELDLQVWSRLFPVIYRRIKRYLGLDDDSLESFVRVLGFRWAAEGWDFSVDELSPERAVLTVKAGGCPYLEALKRAGRPDKFPMVCEIVCDPIYQIAATAFNPKLKVARPTHQGTGDETCAFVVEMSSIHGGAGD
ncbi:MAG: DUF6125 family protein [Promethearchaeota archaeon]